MGFTENCATASSSQDCARVLRLRDRMARHHRDPDAAYYGWNDVWLDPEFRAWDISDSVARIECPILLIQGERDRYGTMAQLDAVEASRARPGRARPPRLWARPASGAAGGDAGGGRGLRCNSSGMIRRTSRWRYLRESR